jgi:soluble lytic murein transglycosylase-like protein
MKAEDLNESQIRYAQQIGQEAQRMGINPDFVLPMVAAESKFDPKALSPKGAVGLMQLMPNTAKELGVNPYDINQNIQGGLRYLKQLSSMPNIGTNPVALLAAYNAGPNSKFLVSGDPNEIPEETANYVKRIESYSGGQLRNPFIGLEGETEGAGVGEGQASPGGEVTPASEFDFQRLLLDLGGAGAGAAFSAGSQLTGAAGRRLVDALEGMSRIGQPSGTTSGEKWLANWAGVNKPGVGGVPEATATYQRMKDHGKVSGRATKMFGPRMPGEPASIVDRLMARGQQREALARQQQSPMNMLRRGVSSPLGRVGIGALGGLSAAEQAQAGLEKYAEQDMPMAAAYGVGAAGSALAAFPYGPTQIAGGAMALSPMAMYLYRKATEKGEGKPSGLPATYNPYFAP